MEKKIKKLQLRKETIAILNGEKMAHIIGGGSGLTGPSPCGEYAEWFIIGPGPDNGACKCIENYVGDPYVQCRPQVTVTDNLCSGTCGHSFACQPSRDIVCHK